MLPSATCEGKNFSERVRPTMSLGHPRSLTDRLFDVVRAVGRSPRFLGLLAVGVLVVLFRRWKFTAVVGGLVATAIWTGLVGGDHMRHAPGPVCRAHATWEARCSVCHEPGVSLSGRSRTAALFAANSERCTTCHAGPPHHASQRKEPACAECHTEHRGRDVVLSRVADGVCLRC